MDEDLSGAVRAVSELLGKSDMMSLVVDRDYLVALVASARASQEYVDTYVQMLRKHEERTHEMEALRLVRDTALELLNFGGEHEGECLLPDRCLTHETMARVRRQRVTTAVRLALRF